MQAHEMALFDKVDPEFIILAEQTLPHMSKINHLTAVEYANSKFGFEFGTPLRSGTPNELDFRIMSSVLLNDIQLPLSALSDCHEMALLSTIATSWLFYWMFRDVAKDWPYYDKPLMLASPVRKRLQKILERLYYVFRFGFGFPTHTTTDGAFRYDIENAEDLLAVWGQKLTIVSVANIENMSMLKQTAYINCENMFESRYPLILTGSMLQTTRFNTKNYQSYVGELIL